MLKAAEFDGSVTPSHWRRSNWLLHVCCSVLVFLIVGAADLCYSCAGCIYAEEHATHRNGRSRFSDVLVA
jgi:hypothetical protein